VLEIDRAETVARYRERWRQHGYGPKTLGWDKGRQRVRFCAALEGLAEEDYASILDVGCGFGDLLDFLRERNWHGQYLGVDIVPELIEEAQKRHASERARFSCEDVSANSRTESTTMAVALGVFNHRLVQDNREFVRTVLSRLWECATRVVVLDFLSSAADARSDNLFYADPCEVFNLARRFSRRVVIHHGYMPFEFQVKLWHDDAFSVEAPTFSPYRALI
jgi:SAM-dependent methyltransferase